MGLGNFTQLSIFAVTRSIRGMENVVKGSCHCGNLTYELVTATPPERIRARACGCRFCRVHAARNWSNPGGAVTIRVVDPARLQRYRFAQRTADYLICRTCGAYLGALLSEGAMAWSTLNLRLSDLNAPEDPADYGGEDAEMRVARRKKAWTPTRLMEGPSA